jgi:phosphinothricin acetyltransferase
MTSNASRTAVAVEPMTPADWPDVSAIYLEGIRTGNATFETLAPTWEQWDRAHLQAGRLVGRTGRQIAGWVALSRVSQRSCYAGVAEMSVYVANWARGQGVGDALMKAAIVASEEAGIWTVQGLIFPENTASLRLCAANGFREVGRRERIGKRNGVWRDTVLVERRSKVVGMEQFEIGNL